jgi:hypothetical protein
MLLVAVAMSIGSAPQGYGRYLVILGKLELLALIIGKIRTLSISQVRPLLVRLLLFRRLPRLTQPIMRSHNQPITIALKLALMLIQTRRQLPARSLRRFRQVM